MVPIAIFLERNVNYQMISKLSIKSTQSEPVRFSRDDKEAELFRKAIKQSLEQQVSDEECINCTHSNSLEREWILLHFPMVGCCGILMIILEF